MVTDKDDITVLHDVLTAWRDELVLGGGRARRAETDREYARAMGALARLSPLADVARASRGAGAALHHLVNDETSAVALRATARQWIDAAVAFHARMRSLELVVERMFELLGTTSATPYSARADLVEPSVVAEGASTTVDYDFSHVGAHAHG